MGPVRQKPLQRPVKVVKKLQLLYITEQFC